MNFKNFIITIVFILITSSAVSFAKLYSYSEISIYAGTVQVYFWDDDEDGKPDASSVFIDGKLYQDVKIERSLITNTHDSNGTQHSDTTSANNLEFIPIPTSYYYNINFLNQDYNGKITSLDFDIFSSIDSLKTHTFKFSDSQTSLSLYQHEYIFNTVLQKFSDNDTNSNTTIQIKGEYLINNSNNDLNINIFDLQGKLIYFDYLRIKSFLDLNFLNHGVYIINSNNFSFKFIAK